MIWVVNTTLRPLKTRERGLVGPRAGLYGCGNLASTSIRSQDRAVRSELLYRLLYPGPLCSNIEGLYTLITFVKQ
jgi:hypothetical protein